HGNRIEAHRESEGKATGAYRARASSRPYLSAVTTAAAGVPKKPGTDRSFGKLRRRATEDRLPIGAINARFLAWSKGRWRSNALPLPDIGVDAESGLVHTVIGTAANVHDINAAEALLHGQEKDVYADAGYQGIEKRCQTNPVRWHVAMRPGKRRQLDLTNRLDAIYNQIERLKAGVRAKVEHPFRVLKQQFGYTKTRYRGLMKNIAQITTLFALGNLWMARKALSKA
ncbi:transposase, partial [Paraburkholderia mimosarum]